MENKNKTQCAICNTFITNSGFGRHVKSCEGDYKPYRPMGKSCKFCEIEIPPTENIGNHVRWCDKNPKFKAGKKQKQIHGEIRNCERCGKEFVNFSNKKLCSTECNVVTDETRKKISEGRSRYLQENPDLHPWKNPNKSQSVPCNNVKKYLNDHNIDFVDELSPIAGRAFSIDIAFPHLKIGIEVNGNQHYNRDGSLKPYYQQRHDLIQAEGWRLIQVHYTECFSDEGISKFLNFEIPRDDSGVVLYFKNKKIKAPALPPGQKIRNKTDEKWEPIKHKIFNHGIDFSKFGWVTKVAEVLKIPPQKVSKWMIRYHPEFYEKSCFKRSV